jgi:hypothetical protein
VHQVGFYLQDCTEMDDQQNIEFKDENLKVMCDKQLTNSMEQGPS